MSPIKQAPARGQSEGPNLSVALAGWTEKSTGRQWLITASVAIWTVAEVPGIVKAGGIDRLGGRFVNAKTRPEFDRAGGIGVNSQTVQKMPVLPAIRTCYRGLRWHFWRPSRRRYFRMRVCRFLRALWNITRLCLDFIAAPGNLWRAIRPRLGGTLLSLIVLTAPVIVLFWWFDVTDDLLTRIVVTILVAVLPVLELMSQPRPLRSRWVIFGVGGIVGLAILTLVGERYEWQILKFNAIILLIVVPYFPIVWLLMGPRWLLLSCALLLGLAVMLGYWLKAMVNTDAPFELLLLPVPAFLLAGIVWIPIARGALHWAQRRKKRPMAGPGTQTLAMISLFVPVILVAIFGPVMLELSEIWSAASLTILGVLLSAIISQPLYRFLLEWAKLKPEDEQTGL